MTAIDGNPAQHDENPMPGGWQVIRLRELIREIQPGFACGRRDPQGVIQLRMNNVGTRGNFVWDDVLRVPHDVAPIEEYRLLPGDVLFNNTNSTELVGKSALFEGYPESVVYSNHFTRLRTKTDVLLPAFLAAWLNHQWLRGVFSKLCNRWVGQSAVKGDKLLRLDFPLPSLPEQERIMIVLHEQMLSVERARTAADGQRLAIDAMPGAFLRRAFGGEM